MPYLGSRQRLVPGLLLGGTTNGVGVVDQCEGALGILVKYHSGTSGQAATAWSVRPTWDGVGVSVTGDLNASGIATLALNTAEATAPYICFYFGLAGFAVPIPCDRLFIRVSLGGTTPTNDVANAIFDVWPIYDDEKQHGPDRTRIGMPG